jgi:hypothetical protein
MLEEFLALARTTVPPEMWDAELTAGRALSPGRSAHAPAVAQSRLTSRPAVGEGELQGPPAGARP